MKTVAGLLLLVFMVHMTGCATILDGSSQTVTFNSEPAKAKVFINGVQVCVTPCTTQVKHSKSTIVVAKKDGYEEQHLPLQTTMNKYFWGNFITGGPIGSTTDYVSDAIIEYSPNMYFISLEPIRKSKADRTSLLHEKTLRNFILRGHQQLFTDLARMEGEYLSSLYALLHTDESQRTDTLERLRLVASRSSSPPEFAEAVLREFPRQ